MKFKVNLLDNSVPQKKKNDFDIRDVQRKNPKTENKVPTWMFKPDIIEWGKRKGIIV